MNCPFCAEEINKDAQKCKHCGELLNDDSAPASGSSTGKTVLIVALVCIPICLCVPGILATLLMPALMKAKEKANRTKCANNLRQLGLASLQYSDDKRFFPHVGPIQTLDGGADTNSSTKKTRTVLFYGYHDNPEGFICPSSFDMYIPQKATFPAKSWFWQGAPNPTDGSFSPIADGAPDPNLKDTDELSYGWTRKGMNTNVRSTALLMADRAARDQASMNPNAPMTLMLGNHDDGWNVLKADCTVEWMSTSQQPFPGGFLTATSSPQDGYLGIKVQTDPNAFR
jgi:type II secretory pathway pseudopilin PulG